VGLVGLAVAAATGPWWLAAPALVVLGLGAGSLLSPSLTAFSRTTAGESTIALSLFNLARLGSFGLGGLLGGAFVDAGMPATAFLAVAVLCGLAAAAVSSDGKPSTNAGKEPGSRASQQTGAPEGAGGGTDDG
jgi:MFS family permease